MEGILTKMEKSYILAGYGIHWPSNPKEDDCGRFAKYPITEFRAQLTSILKGLEVAKSNKLEYVHIVTDSKLFLKFKKWNWLKGNGDPVGNKVMYDSIVKMEEGMTVS